MQRIAMLAAMAVLAAGACAAANVEITKQEGKDVLEVVINGEHFTSYHYSNDNRKPFLWPVYCEGGETITRNWPMGEIEGEGNDDHVHHKSLWTSYGDVNGVDCWGEGIGSGYQHSEKVTFESGDAQGVIRAKNVWQNAKHEPVVDESRVYTFHAGEAGCRVIDVEVAFTASYGDVKFGDTKEGGIVSYRLRPEIDQKNIARRKAEARKAARENNEDFDESKFIGEIVNAEGLKGEGRCWGQPSPWTDYYGLIDGVGVRGIAVFDNPDNLRYPTRWHIRGYGLCGANCFGLSYFTAREMKKQGKEPLNGEYLLKNGESLTFKYRVIIHSGTTEEAGIAALYKDYLEEVNAK